MAEMEFITFLIYHVTLSTRTNNCIQNSPRYYHEETHKKSNLHILEDIYIDTSNSLFAW